MQDFKSWMAKSLINALNIKDDTVIITTHILIEKEDDMFVAHSLEFDLVTDGYTEEEVKRGIIDALVSQVDFCIENSNIDKIIRPAPEKEWQKFYAGDQKKRLSYTMDWKESTKTAEKKIPAPPKKTVQVEEQVAYA